MASLPHTHKTKNSHAAKLWQSPANPLSTQPKLAYKKEIAAILARLTLRQKIGQMVQAQMDAITPEQVRDYHIGSVLNGGNVYPNNDKYASTQEWVTMVDTYYRASMDSSNERVAIPIMWGTDAVHGQSKIVGATIFPHNIGLGASRNGALVRKTAEITAIEMLISGVDWNFSPSVAVVRDLRWGRTYESYSENPQLVKELSEDYVLGLQGCLSEGTFMDDSRVMATAKHFIGDGGTEQGIDRGNNIDSEAELYRVHAPGYLSAIKAGVLSIMPSHSMWQGERLHGHHYLLTQVLKKSLGFDGFLIGDWNSHGLLDGCKDSSSPLAVNAGLDMFMVTHEWQAFIENTATQVEAGQISEARINDAVSRILRAKFRAGLFKKGPPSERKHACKNNLLGSPQHREVARQAVRESSVLLKNNDALLPLNPRLNFLVAGDGADNIGKQAGGWTISWSGAGTTNADFPKGTSILSAISKEVNKAGGTVHYDVAGTYTKKPDVAIVAFGEEPYAEWFGDIKHLAYQATDNKDARLLEKLKKAGIPVVALFISGRPLWVNRIINASDAFVAVWLPGTEANGISDLLFTNTDGEIKYDFTGKLPFSWPKSPLHNQLNSDHKDYDPLFPFGYGLSYMSQSQLAELSVEDNIPESLKDPGVWLFNGRAIVPWFIGLRDEDGFSMYLGSRVERPNLSIQAIDRHTQGDAVKLCWSGEKESEIVILNEEITQDYLPYLDKDAALVFEINIAGTHANSLKLSLGDMAKAEYIEVADILEKDMGWQTLSVPLACFKNKGADLSQINKPFCLRSTGLLNITLSNIRIELNAASTTSITCRNDAN
ncbi:exo-1,4-beta-glucosidase [Alteromonadaceae bacterium Bs31]|nr:exo-1,4-beta-glucosidase [Alteromonadaceae bacterium Bs31]